MSDVAGGDGDGDRALWSIDDLGASVLSFSPEDRAALDRWGQGDVVRRLPATWLASAPPEVGGSVAAKTSGMDALDWVIVSQSCDVGATGPGSAHQYVIVAPLIHVSLLAATLADNAVSGRCKYLFPLDLDRASGSVQWLADLRYLMPVAKGVLIGRDPEHAFSEEVRLLEFAERVALKLGRPALSPVLSESAAGVIQKWANKRRKANVVAHVDHVRFIISGGTRLDPREISLLVVTRVGLTDSEQQQWRQDLEPLLKTEMLKSGVAFRMTVIQNLDDITATLLRASVAPDIDVFGPAAWV